MYSKLQQTIEINLKDLFYVILKKTGTIIFAGIVLAGVLFGYKYSVSSGDANLLDTSVRLDNETDVQYSERILNVNRAEDIINSIDALNGQIENQRQYMTESVLMQIDAENEAYTTATFVVTIDDNATTGLDRALVSSYSQDITDGEYLIALANEFGTQSGYITELIKVEYATPNSVVINTSGEAGSAGTVTISVVGPTTEYTDAIMNKILEEVDSKYIELNETMVSHTITLTGLQSSYKIDNGTRDLQYNAINRFEAVQKQISIYDDSLKEVASEIGLSDKNSLYEYFLFNKETDSKSTPSVNGALKYGIIGLAIGMFIAVTAVITNYIFSSKFSTQAKFFGRFPQLYRIGVAKPVQKRSWFVTRIDKKTGDDDAFSAENSYKLMSANIKNLTSGMNKVLFTGTADNNRVKDLVAQLNITADVKSSIFDDPACLEIISEYDGVIVVEQRCYSDCRLVSEEIKYITNADIKLIGAIII